jgi:hypothetical protein
MSAPGQGFTSGGLAEARLRVDPADPVFTDAALSDLIRIGRSAAGRALLRRLHDVGCRMTIKKSDPPTDPPNAWTQLPDPDRPNGDIVIAYDPDDWLDPRFGAPASDIILFGRLLDAIALASGSTIPEECETGVSPEIEAYLGERSFNAGTSVRILQ